MSREVSNSKFASVEFFIVVISCLALSIRPELGWLPLVIACVSWVMRVVWQRVPFQKSPESLLIPIFLLTSVVGVSVAYDPVAAAHKFYLIVGAALLFFSLAHQPKENISTIASVLSLIGAITTIIFIFITDWETFPADVAIINTLGEVLTRSAPQASIQKIFDPQLFQANMVGGINALLIPIAAITSIIFWREKKKIQTIFSVLILSILAIGLVVSSSRAAFVAAFLGISFVFIVGLSQQKASNTLPRFFYALILLLIILIGVFLPLFLAESPLSLSDITSFESRLKLARQTYFLITDFPFTGGGLGSFPGLYSQYILVIPYFMFGYSHNLYLDLTLEQGIFGFLVWISIILVCAIAIGSSIRKYSINSRFWLFALAIYASLVTFLLHGILDDPVYSNSWGLIFLFAIPGIAISLTEQKDSISKSAIKKCAKISLVGLAAISPLVFILLNSFIAAWDANIGAVNMAKIELQNWPSVEWVSGDQSATYSQIEDNFINSLSNNPLDRTAHYRLGLISMAGMDFPAASEHLEVARSVSPEHRGIRKNLGYCYTWLGEFDQAEIVLRQIPEALTEMDTYVWWWQIQGEEELVKNAAEMSRRLSSTDNSNNQSSQP